MTRYDLLIAGGGASGLMCAGHAAALGLKTAVLEKNPRPGRKILISGGGKCNVANRAVSAANYISANPKFCLSALAGFAPDEMPRRLAARGARLEEREHGQIFCVDSASVVLDCLLEQMRMGGAELLAGLKAAEMKKEGELFRVQAVNAQGKKLEFSSRALVLACGGPACPQCGAGSDGFSLARAFGHAIIAPAPALAPLIMPPGWALGGLAGISLPVKISLPGTKHPSFALPLLFTHRGISGPAALQISSYWRQGQPVALDFLPDTPLQAVKEEGARSGGRVLLRNELARRLPDRLAERLLPERLGGRRMADLSKKDWREAAELVHNHQAVPQGAEGWKKAEASTGGVDVGAVSSSTMESALVPGLFFCGEILDVCGQLGGYNLQWAWASGKAAAEGAARFLGVK